MTANPAQAAVFNFSFSNVNGGTNGTVAGTIELPDGDGTFAAIALTVTSAPAALGYTTPFNVLSNFTDGVANSFVVASGQIVAANSSFGAQTAAGGAFALNYSPGTFGSVFSISGTYDVSLGVLDINNTTLTYSPAASAVPEPLTILGASTAAGFGAGFKRKLAKAQKDKKDA